MKILFTSVELASLYIYTDGRVGAWPDARITIDGGRLDGLIALEGVETTDSREWAPGALETSRLSAPVLAGQDGPYGTKTIEIGTLDEVTKSGSMVFGHGTLKGALPDGEYPCGVEVTHFEGELIHDDGTREAIR